MNHLYLLDRLTGANWSQYYGGIVCLPATLSEEEIKQIHPDTGKNVNESNHHGMNGFDWVYPKDVTVKFLGVADSSIEPFTSILSSMCNP